MLSSRMDVVDAGDPAAWEHDPWGNVVAGGCLHGRGAVDVRGPLALQVYAAARFVEERPAGDVRMIFPGAVILAQATGCGLCTGHRGHAQLAVKLHAAPRTPAPPSTGAPLTSSSPTSCWRWTSCHGRSP